MPKTWIIPDIHGFATTLKTMVGQQIKPDKSDRLIFLGDYIDRGPDSKGVLDFIMQLQEDGYNIIPLKGNHEDTCVKTWEAEKERKLPAGWRSKSQLQKAWENFGGIQTMKSFHVTRVVDIPEKYIRWMAALDYFLETENLVAVHAGLNFYIDDPFSDIRSMLWIREFSVKPEKIDHKILVHGHMPVDLKTIDQSVRKENPVSVDLDNGIYVKHLSGYGHLVALEANSMKYRVQTVVEETG